MQRLQDISETIGAVALFIVMAVIFCSVIARQVFGFIIPDAFDLSRMFLGVLVTWGIAGAVAWRSLITADFLYQALGQTGRRILDLAGSACTLVILALLSWRMVLTVIDAQGNGIRTQDTGIPLWYFYAACALALLVAAGFALRNTWLALVGEPKA
ncbi:TRAP transporter small permease [Mameliella sediminis]|uniref:TRAP transporter small permease n=1 Tax=Mameliella sediminis TaxID=2836866 RepID=UPI001C46F694|nr:TRAP transporter small permease [Mameliella sediminis]MBY6114873.1 TRAP transporter small permease [Antarctobacter heliothermus]MBY6144446.1 TRAP transporter small permease [Mameliella alba]MCA0954495.1 TRAP transporter small permease [Mameliella alba]